MSLENDEKENRASIVLPVVEGDCCVSDNPEIVFSTVLGSCISVCMYDPIVNVGGMNHFLLPGSHASPVGDLKYGIHSMEQLIAKLLHLGADHGRLLAKMFGGSKLTNGGPRIGEENQKFARAFLMQKGIECVASHLGGSYARKIRFEPTNGRVRHMLVPLEEASDEVPIVFSMLGSSSKIRS